MKNYLENTYSKMNFKRGTKFIIALPDIIKYWDCENNNEILEELSFGCERKINLICNEGHKWETNPSRIKCGKWCPYCSNNKLSSENTFAHYHPDKIKNWSPENDRTPYEVSKSSDYIPLMICDCGYEFRLRCGDITKGKWCANCASRRKIDNDYVDLKLKDRSIVRIGNYKNARLKLLFKCNVCNNNFESNWDSIYNKNVGCSICCASKGETAISDYLTKVKLEFDREYSFEGLKGIGNGSLRFDFAIFINGEIKLVEYDGIFHYEKQYNDDGFQTIKIHDKLKNEYCIKNNISLLRIPYWEFDNIEELIHNFLMPIPSQDSENH